jgi:hypothetical protein
MPNKGTTSQPSCRCLRLCLSRFHRRSNSSRKLDLTIHRHAPKGYVAARKKDGWLKSQVFGKSFRLTRQEDEFGNPEYTLEAR